MRRAMNMNPIKKWSDLTKDTEYQVCSDNLCALLALCMLRWPCPGR